MGGEEGNTNTEGVAFGQKAQSLRSIAKGFISLKPQRLRNKIRITNTGYWWRVCVYVCARRVWGGLCVRALSC